MGYQEKIEFVKNQATIRIDGNGEEICPLTGKPPKVSRCFGQLSLRMTRGGGVCEAVCDALLDDLKIREFGGRASVNFNLPVPRN